MKIFRKPYFTASTGDAVPFYHDGIYHIFSLTPPEGTTVYPARLRTIWSHTISKDLVNWEELPAALFPSDDKTAPDASGIWTGSVIYGEGKYHIFYTGYSLNVQFQQTICHAVSDDSIKWEKNPNNPIIVPDTSLYEPLDWRDPYVFYNEEENKYWMLLSARKNNGPAARRGCVILYTSVNLDKWTYYGPLYAPGHTNCPECPEMYKIGDKWYLSYSRFSEFGNTIYRVAETPYGPWKTPKMDGIGGRRFYAAKSMANDNGRRFYFGWAHDRAEDNDNGEWYWGGIFCVPHEVVQNQEGELDVKLPQEIVASIDKDVSWKLIPKMGEVQSEHDNIEVDSLSTFSYGFFDHQEQSFLFSCVIEPIEVYDHFGLLFKSDEDASVSLILQFDIGMNRVSLLNLPMAVDPFWQQSCQSIPSPTNPGPDGVRVAEKPFIIEQGHPINVQAIIDKDMVEVFINNQVAFTYRIFKNSEYEVGYLVQDGIVNFKGISIRK